MKEREGAESKYLDVKGRVSIDPSMFCIKSNILRACGKVKVFH